MKMFVTLEMRSNDYNGLCSHIVAKHRHACTQQIRICKARSHVVTVVSHLKKKKKEK